MEITTLTISLVINAALLTIAVVLVLHLKSARDRLFRKDGFIRVQKHKLSEAQQEIARKEQVILKEKGKGKLTTQFFAEQEYDDGFWSKKYIVRYRFQMLLNGHPIGQAGTISVETYKQTNTEQINKILDDFAKPLIEAGAEIAVKKLAAA